jgi:hypothetical protein
MSKLKKRKAPTTRKRAAAKKTTKKAMLIAMLNRPDGVTLAQIQKAMGWKKAASCRGALSTLGAESFQEEGQERRYRLKGA